MKLEMCFITHLYLQASFHHKIALKYFGVSQSFESYFIANTTFLIFKDFREQNDSCDI